MKSSLNVDDEKQMHASALNTKYPMNETQSTSLKNSFVVTKTNNQTINFSDPNDAYFLFYINHIPEFMKKGKKWKKMEYLS